MTRHRISTHFVVEEFDCHNGAKVPTAAHDALALWAKVWGEPLRDAFGPVRITSGFRPAAYNASVGGAPQSFHRYELRYGPSRSPSAGVGVAADCTPSTGTPAAWQSWAAEHVRGAVARIGRAEGVNLANRGAAVAYPRSGFIHLDTGPRRSWVG
jgi:hypothetical protein